MKKDGVIYKGMKKYRTKFLIINILLTCMFIFYCINKAPYLKAQWTEPEPLVIDRFLAETKTFVVDDLVELGRKDRKNPDASYLKKTSYWQGMNYRYAIEADSISETDVVYKGKVTAMGSSDFHYEDMYKLYLAEIGGRNVAVLAFADQKVTKNMTACIVNMQKPILAGISQLVEDSPLEISDYVFDVRGLEMEAETSDHEFFWIYLVVILMLYIKLIRYYIDPRQTPTYKQLSRYGKSETVEEEIDREFHLPSVRRNGKEIILDEFILTKGFMKLIVTKNHMAKN